MKQKYSRMHHYQNLILEGFWRGVELASRSVCAPECVAAYKEYKRPSKLYHYTSVDAACSILSSRENNGFAFTHYKFLNDRREFDWGLSIAEKWLKERGGGTFGDCSFAKRIFAYIKDHKDDQSCIPYVLSFTTEKDSTPQWMAYTDHHSGGLAIGISFDKLQRAIRNVEDDDLSALHYNGILFAPCIYHAEDDGDNIVAFEKVLDCVLAGAAKAEYHESEERFLRWCAGRIFQFAALVKSGAFRFENEWRLVICPRNLEYADQIEFIGGKPRIRPDIVNLNDFVNSIRVSPQGPRERLKLTAELIRLKLDKTFRVAESKSSFVG